MPKTEEKWIDETVGAFADPIIVFPGGWGEDTPKWLKDQITLERLLGNMGAIKGEELMASDGEATAYLMSASLSQPMTDDWATIYLYVAGQAMQKFKHAETPEDIKVESLTEYQMKKLNDLKRWIYETRVKQRKERTKGEKKASGEQPKFIQKQIPGF